MRRWLVDAALLASPSSPALLRERLQIAVKEKDAGAVSRYCRRLVDASPDERSARDMLAGLELTAGRVDAARALVAKGGKLRLVRESLMDPARARSEGAYVGTVRDVLVETADWSIIDGERVYNDEAHNRNLQKSPFVGGRVSPDGKWVLFDLPPVARHVDERCVYLGGDNNYCHWLQRNLIKLALLEGSPEAELPLLVNEDLKGYQRDYLEMLGIPESRLVKAPRPGVVACRELVVPVNLVNHVKMGIGIDWLRARLRDWMAPSGSRRLFVSRRDTSLRRLLNEDEVASRLATYGFETIVPGEMSVREQVRAFSEASLVVAAHGAAFGNMMFAPRDAKVLEINSTLKDHFPEFPFMAKIMGHGFASVVSDDYAFSPSQAYLPDTDFSIDPDEVVAALLRLAPEVRSP